jgi:hypothetical protein
MRDPVLVKEIVMRVIFEPRTDADGVEDYYRNSDQIVFENEWFMEREEAEKRYGYDRTS